MRTLRNTLRVPIARVALAVLLLVALLAVFGGQLAPHDPLAQDIAHVLQGPSGAHLLGTDYLGRDTLSRLIAGTRVTILGSFATVALGFLLGVLPGIISAFLGRTSEFFVMRFIDSLLTLPIIVLAVAATGLFSNGTGAVVIAVGVLLAPRFGDERVLSSKSSPTDAVSEADLAAERAIRELARVVRKGGHVVVAVPFLQPYHACPGDFRRYTADGLAQLGRGARLEVIDVLPVQGINVYDILRRNTLVLTRAALDALEARLK